MNRLSFLLLASICFAFPVQAQYRGLAPLFRIPTAETNSGAPLAEDEAPQPPKRKSRSLSEHFKIYADGARIPDKNNPQLKNEQLDIKGLIDWKFDNNPYGILVYCYSDGQVYLIIRDSKWGRDAYGFGESLIKSMTMQGLKVTRKGEIDFEHPYILRHYNEMYEIETYRDTNWVEKFFEITSGAVQNIIIPKMANLPMKRFQQSEMEVGEAINFRPLKDWLWQDEKGKTFKPDLDGLNQLIEKQEKALAEKEQKTLAQENKPE